MSNTQSLLTIYILNKWIITWSNTLQDLFELCIRFPVRNNPTRIRLPVRMCKVCLRGHYFWNHLGELKRISQLVDLSVLLWVLIMLREEELSCTKVSRTVRWPKIMHFRSCYLENDQSKLTKISSPLRSLFNSDWLISFSR